MSGVDQIDLAAEARDWVYRLAQGGPDEPEALAACEAWRARSPAHDAAFNDAWDAWHLIGETEVALAPDLAGRAGGDAAAAGPAPLVARRLEPTHRPHGRPRRSAARARRLARGAAAGARGTAHRARPHRHHPDRRNRVVALADGSRLAVGAGSNVDVRLGKDRREVVLDRGQAFFEVAHDPARPFYVIAGRAEIRVTGTRFDVRRVGDNVQVSVLDGRVEVRRRGLFAPVLPAPRPDRVLTAGERVRARPRPGSGLRARAAGPRHSGRVAQRPPLLRRRHSGRDRRRRQPLQRGETGAGRSGAGRLAHDHLVPRRRRRRPAGQRPGRARARQPGAGRRDHRHRPALSLAFGAFCAPVMNLKKSSADPKPLDIFPMRAAGSARQLGVDAMSQADAMTRAQRGTAADQARADPRARWMIHAAAGAIACAALVPSAMPAHAQAQGQAASSAVAVPIDIASQPLAEALMQLARQTNVDISAPSRVTRGRTAPAVSGTLTVPQALARLLAGTPLSARALRPCLCGGGAGGVARRRGRQK